MCFSFTGVDKPWLRVDRLEVCCTRISTLLLVQECNWVGGWLG
jgi:hypothetical protein